MRTVSNGRCRSAWPGGRGRWTATRGDRAMDARCHVGQVPGLDWRFVRVASASRKPASTPPGDEWRDSHEAAVGADDHSASESSWVPPILTALVEVAERTALRRLWPF